ncbi:MULTISPECIES: molybdenum cofactor guanylyltransferase [Acidianus]|uniref:Molybdopterin-guanine dinucleotide biosynthesis protein A n=1 Tax=Candidatus Acidianus copahuensis TaxID=1160895 RepID=A0A031LK81_9CREN|nr:MULTISPECIES: molybdenum cofactor guanylyltransferase [Acidianus]EZQ03213.1 molybdopterin-guanine dinucleotide biosynthesis protein A [Candidatus Acidianus copahuensis]NON63614.1 molybdenum cofactor guanylyltransferase [Acidianus sp. RZ1]
MKLEARLKCKSSWYDVIVLAGGESKRFGCDKCDFELSGKSMLKRVVEQFNNAIIVSRFKRGITKTEILDKGNGPLRAVEYALPYIRSEKVFITGCDFPFVRTSIADLLCSKDFDAVIPILDQPQPLLGCYKTNFLLRNISKVNSFMSLLRQSNNTYLIGTEELRLIDPSLLSLRNINYFIDLLKPVKVFTKSTIILK